MTAFGESNVMGDTALQIDVSAESDGGAFVSISITTESGMSRVDMNVTDYEDVDELERMVTEACAEFRRMMAMDTQP